jgi:L-phenylalanine/L-methionine N-acetyltransferase
VEASRPEQDILIRPARVEDAEDLAAIRRQPSVARYTLGLPSTRAADVRRRLEGLGPDDHQLVAVVDGRAVATAGLHLLGGKQRHVGSVGLMVHEEYRGRGIGRALTEALLDLADRYLALGRVELDVVAGNEGAIRLYERLGFEREGVKRAALVVDGRYADVLVMARLRPRPSP